MVATLDVPTLKNVKVALETLDMLGDHPGPPAPAAQPRRRRGRASSAEKVEAILGMPVAAQIATSIEIAAATNAGRPIVLSAPDHPSSRAVRTLGGRRWPARRCPKRTTSPTKAPPDDAGNADELSS